MWCDLRSDESAERGTGWLSGVGKLQVLTNGSLFGVLKSDGREGLDVEVGSFGAGLDELSGQGEDSAGLESSVESGRDWLGARCDTDECLVTGLDSDDGTGSREDVGRVDKGSGTEVGRDTDTFEELGGGNEGGDVGDTEVVLASSDGLVTEGRLEELNVGDFITTNFEESLSDRWLETGVGKVLGRELLQGVVVEDGLEVLEGQGVLQRWKRGGRLSQLCVHDDAKGS